MKYSLHITISENDEDLDSDEIVAIKDFDNSNEMFESCSKYLPSDQYIQEKVKARNGNLHTSKKSLLAELQSTFSKDGFVMFDWRKQNTKNHYYFVFVTNETAILHKLPKPLY